MATYTPKRLTGPAQVANSATDVYTVPGATSVVVKQIVFNNTSASAVNVTAYVIPVGGTAGPNTAIISALSIAPNSQVIWSADIPMASGEKLNFLASATTSVTYLVSGIEIV